MKNIDWDLSPGRNMKAIGYYMFIATRRGDFKKTCIKRGLRFQDFDEVESDKKIGAAKQYYYVEKDEKDKIEETIPMLRWNTKPKCHYAKKSTARASFKVICKRGGMNFEDFEEVYSGEKKGTNRKYYYKLK